MAIVQPLSPEICKIIEKRHEMILAHEKFGMEIKRITEKYGFSIGTYYYWHNRYLKEGLLGLVDKKPGAIVPYNKTPHDIEAIIKQIALDNKELDANEIYDIAAERYGYNKTIRTIENILQRHHLNRGRGRRSKKTRERKKAIQDQQQRLKM